MTTVGWFERSAVWGTANSNPTKESSLMYIGLGTLVIVIILLILIF